MAELCLAEKQSLQLTQDVFDAILEFLEPFLDKYSLRQCALASRCLLDSAQRILFRDICLFDNEPVTGLGFATAKKFQSLLKTSPRLSAYPKRLELALRPALWGDDLSHSPLSFIVPQLQALDEIEIFTEGPGTATSITFLQLYALLGGMGIPRTRSLKLTSLRVVELKDVIGICEWFAARGGLQDLSLIGLGIENTTSPTSASTKAQPWSATSHAIQLRSFGVTRVDSKSIDALLDWVISPSSCLRLHKLQKFAVSHWTEESSAHLQHILTMAQNSLQSLNPSQNLSGRCRYLQVLTGLARFYLKMAVGPAGTRCSRVVMGCRRFGQVILREHQAFLGSRPKNSVYIATTSVHGLLRVGTGVHMYDRATGFVNPLKFILFPVAP